VLQEDTLRRRRTEVSAEDTFTRRGVREQHQELGNEHVDPTTSQTSVEVDLHIDPQAVAGKKPLEHHTKCIQTNVFNKIFIKLKRLYTSKGSKQIAQASFHTPCHHFS